MSSIRAPIPPTTSSYRSLLGGDYETVYSNDADEVRSDSFNTANRSSTLRKTPMTSDSENSVHQSSKNWAWIGGWLTPLIISLCFILALLVAVAHYVYCRSLDKKPENQTVSQRWNYAISIAFARAFSLLLIASASQAFSQVLWWYFRRRLLSISMIDALFSLNTGPLKLYRLDILRYVPVLWVFGLLFPLIPISTLFPSGALVIQQLAYPDSELARVPTLDVDYHGNGSAVAFFQNAMFTPGYDGEYRWPADRYRGLARKTLLQGAFIARPSPCGLDCSYNLTFAAPSLRCSEATTIPNISSLNMPIAYVQSFTDLKDSDPRHYNYMVALIISNKTIIGQLQDEAFVLFVSYRAPTENTYRFISCLTMDATYNSQVMYKNGTQSIKLQITNKKPLNASSLKRSELFYDLMVSESGSAPMKYPTRYRNQSKAEILSSMHGTQLRAMSDAMISCLAGYISDYGDEVQIIVNTMIQETPLAIPIRNASFYRFVDLRLKLSPSVLEDLMKNTSISILNDATNITNTMVETVSYENAYVFEDPRRLILSYAAALATCLIFNLFGLIALKQNGVAADSGIFLQVLCATTNGTSVLNALAKKACLGGSNNHSSELLDLKVRFGEVKDDTRLAAFGTVAETTKLKKGKKYGKGEPDS